MAKSIVPVGKARFTFTLSVENMEWFHVYLKKRQAPKGLMSAMIDEYLKDLHGAVDDLEARHEQKGSLGIGDLFSIAGKILENKENPKLPLKLIVD